VIRDLSRTPVSDNRRSRRRRNERGAAIVEFSLVIGIFVLVLYALIYFGMALATKQRVTNAAAEGARAAVGAASAADAQSKAQNRILSLLDAPNGRYTPNAVAAPCDTADPGGPQCITVTIDYHWDTHPVVPAAPGLGLAPVNTLGSKAVVQYAG
jgi:Flp pilus assembly protein TadG